MRCSGLICGTCDTQGPLQDTGAGMMITTTSGTLSCWALGRAVDLPLRVLFPLG